MAWPEKRIELSEDQQLAVQTVGKNVCVSAGAGSGKTGVLVERFLYLVSHHRISPANILTLTFTEKAAHEMKRRIVKRLQKENLEEARRQVENAYVGTIHALCARLLSEHPIEAGVDPYFVIFEEEEAASLKEEVLDQIIEKEVTDPEVFNLVRLYEEKYVREGILQVFEGSRHTETPLEVLLRKRTQVDRSSLELTLRKGLKEVGQEGPEASFSFQEIAALTQLRKGLKAVGKQKEAISRVKATLDDWVSLLYEEQSLPLREVFIRLALQFEKAYEEAKRAERALDFDDLQLLTVKLLGSDTPASRALRKIYQEKFHEILVDEFQDIDPLQNRLIDLMRREANLFIVGDMKQSIYAFRGTQVEIFIEKQKALASSPQGICIPLVRNYRARPRLIDFVNRFFEKLWSEDAFPFESLEADRDEEGEGPRVEWLALEEKGKESTDEIRIREARTLAERIRSLVEEEHFQYKEIACLFEAMTNVHFYEQEFRRAGIPYYVVSNRGFYHQPEIRDTLSFLSTLENPKWDIPLAASLRSPLFQISDDSLFWLAHRAKAEKKETPLYEGLRQFESIMEISLEEKEKLRFFKEVFDDFLRKKEKLRISELIETLLGLTDYDLYVLKLRQGSRRFANLKKLVELAREMESKESLHLGDFVRAVKGIETREVRESQAQGEAEEGNVVRLMSIHMAKGLEFPVVVLPDLGRKDWTEGGRFLISEEEGFGIKAWDEGAFDFQETLTFRQVKRRKDEMNSAESKRKLYVAMTRSQEKLILVGPQSTSAKKSFHEMTTWAQWVDRILNEGEWEIKRLSEVRAPAFPFERRKALADRKPIRSKLASLSPIRLRRIPEGVDRILENLTAPEKVSFERIDLPVSAFLLFAKDPEAYFRVYEIGIPEASPLTLPSPPLGERVVVRGVEIKSEEYAEEDANGLRPAEFGTRVHQILEQLLTRRLAPREIDSLLLRFTEDLGKKEREEISEIVHRFLASEQAKEILRAGVFYPELPFVLRLPHGLVQGTMDLIYQNQKGEWLILDYKTSVVERDTLAERGEEYRIQLELYALALWQILGHPPAEARIHFLRAGLSHTIPFDPRGFEALWEKFTALQKEILDFRERSLSNP